MPGVSLGDLHALSMIGLLIGSVLTFLARLLGYPVLNLPTKQNTANSGLLRVRVICCFPPFFLPGLPKDLLTYVAGLTYVPPPEILHAWHWRPPPCPYRFRHHRREHSGAEYDGNPAVRSGPPFFARLFFEGPDY